MNDKFELFNINNMKLTFLKINLMGGKIAILTAKSLGQTVGKKIAILAAKSFLGQTVEKVKEKI